MAINNFYRNMNKNRVPQQSKYPAGQEIRLRVPGGNGEQV
jgi:hypothetical protein